MVKVCFMLVIRLSVCVIMANKKSHIAPYILVVSCDSDKAEKDIELAMNKETKKHILKSKTVRTNMTELNYEIRLASESTNFVNEIKHIVGVNSVVLVSYNGDYMG